MLTESGIFENKATHIILLVDFYSQEKSFRHFGVKHCAGQCSNLAGYLLRWHDAAINQDRRPSHHAIIFHRRMLSQTSTTPLRLAVLSFLALFSLRGHASPGALSRPVRCSTQGKSHSAGQFAGRNSPAALDTRNRCGICGYVDGDNRRFGTAPVHRPAFDCLELSGCRAVRWDLRLKAFEVQIPSGRQTILLNFDLSSHVRSNPDVGIERIARGAPTKRTNSRQHRA